MSRDIVIQDLDSWHSSIPYILLHDILHCFKAQAISPSTHLISNRVAPSSGFDTMASRIFTPRILRAVSTRPGTSPVIARTYHSTDFPTIPSPFNPTETKILTAALKHVPTYGFTTTALATGAREAGYLDITTNLFPSGAFDLVRFHLWREREALKNVKLEEEQGTGKKVRELVVKRLQANEEVIGKWHEVCR